MRASQSDNEISAVSLSAASASKDDQPSPWILVVEEDSAYRELLQEAIQLQESAGGTCILCDGDAALLFCRGVKATASFYPPRLVLLDLRQDNRRRFIRRLRANSHVASTPIALILPSDDPKDILACQESGADGYVVKPDTFAELAALLADLCRHGLGPGHFFDFSSSP